MKTTVDIFGIELRRLVTELAILLRAIDFQDFFQGHSQWSLGMTELNRPTEKTIRKLPSYIKSGFQCGNVIDSLQNHSLVRKNIQVMITLKVYFQLVEDLPSGCKFNCFNWITLEPDQTRSNSLAFEQGRGEGRRGRGGISGLINSLDNTAKNSCWA